MCCGDCSLSVKQGEKVALVGVSGAGKSTIIQLISRFYDTTKGEVRIGGRNVRDIRYEDLLAHISIVFQKTFLTRDSVLENIRMGTQATLEQENALYSSTAAHIRHLPWLYLGLFLTAAALMLLLIRVLSRAVVRPLLRLAQASRSIAEGDFSRPDLPVKSSDEVGRLTGTSTR